jgi:hypothetical protein
MILCAVLCAGAAAVQADTNVSAVTLRNPGGRTAGAISVSLQNEVNAAVDRGRAWLLVCQNADGSWGSNACPRLTALAALALAHNPSPAEQAAVEKAGRWLLPAPTNQAAALRDVETMAWRKLALQAAALQDPPRTNDLRNVLAACFSNAPAPFAAMLVREAFFPNGSTLLFPEAPAANTNAAPTVQVYDACVRSMPAASLPGTAAAASALRQLAALWSPQKIPLDPSQAACRQYWTLAHFINRAGGGTLADAQGNVLDWRSDLARTLVETQKIDADRQGNGYWHAETAPADWASHPIAETAFSLLALDEL